jgi:ribosomal protein L40E
VSPGGAGVKCPGCGTDNPAGSTFCLSCGARQAPACGACGAELPPGARFCNRCGDMAMPYWLEQARVALEDPALRAP